MKSVQKAQQVLRDAETALQAIMQAEIADKGYSSISEIAKMADGISKLLNNRNKQNTPAVITQSPLPSNNNYNNNSSAKTIKKPERIIRTKNTKSQYPKFRFEDNRLIKTGWSKKNKTEYEHRAPEEIVKTVLKHFTDNIKPDKIFQVEDLLPVPNSDNHGEVPAYQVYMVLAWLIYEGAVEKKGRDGYFTKATNQDLYSYCIAKYIIDK